MNIVRCAFGIVSRFCWRKKNISTKFIATRDDSLHLKYTIHLWCKQLWMFIASWEKKREGFSCQMKCRKLFWCTESLCGIWKWQLDRTHRNSNEIESCSSSHVTWVNFDGIYFQHNQLCASYTCEFKDIFDRFVSSQFGTDFDATNSCRYHLLIFRKIENTKSYSNQMRSTSNKIIIYSRHPPALRNSIKSKLCYR